MELVTDSSATSGQDEKNRRRHCTSRGQPAAAQQPDRPFNMDMREARRTAEKAARELLGGPLITAAGALGVAIAAQQTAAAGILTAQDRAQQHLQQAQREAEQIITNARTEISTADNNYRQAHQDAVTAGWAPAALTDMGYPPPGGSAKRPKARNAAVSNPASSPTP